MSSVISRNTFDLLGNDVFNDEEQVASPELKLPGTKATTSSNKRDSPRVQQGQSTNKGTKKEEYGREQNRARPTDEPEDGQRGGPRRGGRGGRPPRDDRHTKGLGRESSDKQTAQSWGAVEGKAELKDEEAGEQMAKEEQKDEVAEEAEEAEPAEPEVQQLTLDEYQEKMSEMTASLNANLSIRAANEGYSGKTADQELKKEEEEYFAGAPRPQRQRHREANPNVLAIDHALKDERPARDGGRFEGRGRGRGRGGARGARGSGGRRADPATPINTQDETAFPSLGS